MTKKEAKDKERAMRVLYKMDRSKKKGTFEEWLRKYQWFAAERERNFTIGDFLRGEIAPDSNTRH